MIKSKRLRAIIIILAISLIAECFIFNFRFWESRSFTSPSHDHLTYGAGLSKISPSDTKEYQISDSNNAYIEISNLHCAVKNIYLNVSKINSDEKSDDAVKIQVLKTESGNDSLSILPETEVVGNINESKYIRLHLSGKSSKIRINFLEPKGTAIRISSVRVNAHRPFDFSLKRFVLLFIILLLLWMFRASSLLYRKSLNWNSNKQKFLIIGIAAALSLLFLGIWHTFKMAEWKNASDMVYREYDYLAISLSQGHPWLNFKPSELLLRAKDPYSMKIRFQVILRKDGSSIMDFAYYKGKYYCYFGVVPVLLTFLPYQLITGNMLDPAIPNLLFSIGFIVAAFWFVYTLLKKYYPNVSVGMYLLLSFALVMASQVIYAIQVSTIYSIPFSSGLFFDVLGLTCWLKASRKNQDGVFCLKKKWLILGAFCIALSIGCRPQLAVAALFAFPIFWQEIKAREFFSKRGLMNTLCVILPFIAVMLPICYYNAIRFDSPFNFGATYNLTGFDMTKRGIIPQRLVLGYFEYLFQPFVISGKFPYFSVSGMFNAMATDYQGQLINEPFQAGFFAFNMIGLFVFGIRRCRKQLKERHGYGLCWSCVAASLLIIALDTQMVGINQRYLMDFSFFLMIPAILVIASFESKIRLSEDQSSLVTLFYDIVIILGAFCVMGNLMALLANGRTNDLLTMAPHTYYMIKYKLFLIFSIR